MKLETEADDSLCLFISAERRTSGGVESGGCSIVAGERTHSAQGPIDKLSGSQPPTVADHIIVVAPRITASGRGTPSAGDSTTPPTTNGFQNGHHQYQVPQTTTISSLINCEHFRFIDDEDVNDDEDVCDGVADSVGELPICDDDNRSNGISNTDVRHTEKCASLSSSVPSADGGRYSPPARHLQTHDLEAQVEVSDLNNSDLQKNNSNDIADPTGNMGDDHKSKKEKRKKKDADGERHHHQQQQQFVRPIRCNCHNMKDLKSVLKKGGQSDRSSKKGRVTFDESVTLYSDEFEDVQLLALRSAPEVNCAEVFYMFEPPIEYQDLLQPFEPPAEYRDPDTSVDVDMDEVTTPKKILLEGTGEINLKETNIVLIPEGIVVEAPITAENKEENSSVIANENDNTDLKIETAEIEAEVNNNNVVTGEKSIATEVNVAITPVAIVSESESEINPTEESEKLFERFLEAEREFAEDEDLNRVFHVLEADDFATNDEKSGTFDDNFFKKLIDLLSSVEGDVQLREGDFFSTTDFSLNEEDFGFQNDMKVEKDDDAAQQHSRTVSEADSDCSVSSQDTIIVRLGDEDATTALPHAQICRQLSESDQSVEDAGLVNALDEITLQNKEPVSEGCSDDVFREKTETTLLADEGLCSDENVSKQQLLSSAGRNPNTKSSEPSNNTGDLSRQSSGEQPPKDTVQDADDSTSSDSRSGEVEEDIRLDDIGYDEEDADDYDEECLRGMVRGNSKIRRIIKKNALQCTLLRGIEARRRGQSQPNSIKYPRPKSPPLSQESLVEQLKWLTTMDNEKDLENAPTYGTKPPDVILSTGSVPLNGNLHCQSSEDEMNGRLHHRPPQQTHPYQSHQPRHLLASDGKGLYVIAPQSGGGYAFPTHGPPRLWHPVVNSRAQVPPQQQRPYAPRGAVHPMPSSQMPSHQDSERVAAASPVPRDFRDWRVIQRVMMVDRGNGNNLVPRVGFRRCPNGSINACYPRVLPPNVGRPLNAPTNDELEQFVQQDSQRIERIRKRYSVAEDEEEDDPTFGFARRPSVRVVQSRLPPSDHQPSDLVLHTQSADIGLKHLAAYATTVNELPVQRSVPMRQRATMNHELSWNRGPNWMPGEPPVGYCVPEGAGIQRAQPMPVHRASVALTDLSGCATLPHPKTHSDPRYHSYAESAYGGSQTLPHKRWPSANSRPCLAPGNNASSTLYHQMPRTIGPPGSTLQVPPTHITSDERGVPEGASSSPKVSSDSLYHAPPMQETVPPVGPAHKDDSVIYYSMNV